MDRPWENPDLSEEEQVRLLDESLCESWDVILERSRKGWEKTAKKAGFSSVEEFKRACRLERSVPQDGIGMITVNASTRYFDIFASHNVLTDKTTIKAVGSNNGRPVILTRDPKNPENRELDSAVFEKISQSFQLLLDELRTSEVKYVEAPTMQELKEEVRKLREKEKAEQEAEQRAKNIASAKAKLEAKGLPESLIKKILANNFGE